MSLIYCGDIHGKLDKLEKIINYANSNSVENIIQVGDFGLFFPTKDSKISNNPSNDIWRDNKIDIWIKERSKRNWSVSIYTCGGNHDNWNVLYKLWKEQGFPSKIELYPNSGVYYVSRGSVIDIGGISHLFIGGAESTDRGRRIENLTWWDAEEPTEKEFELFYSNLEKYKPDTIISHDAPLRVKLFRARRKSSYTPNMLEKYLNKSKYRPSNWMFGHHHLLQRWKISGIKFFCCGLEGQFWQRDDISGWSNLEV